MQNSLLGDVLTIRIYQFCQGTRQTALIATETTFYIWTSVSIVLRDCFQLQTYIHLQRYSYHYSGTVVGMKFLKMTCCPPFLAIPATQRRSSESDGGVVDEKGNVVVGSFALSMRTKTRKRRSTRSTRRQNRDDYSVFVQQRLGWTWGRNAIMRNAFPTTLTVQESCGESDQSFIETERSDTFDLFWGIPCQLNLPSPCWSEDNACAPKTP